MSIRSELKRMQGKMQGIALSEAAMTGRHVILRSGVKGFEEIEYDKIDICEEQAELGELCEQMRSIA